jgi:uncharacterized protein (UPF0210 family)
MQIRSVTLLTEPHFDQQRAAGFYAEARQAFDFTVQTTRLATTPFPTWLDPRRHIGAEAGGAARQWLEAGADYVCLGPVQLGHDAGWLDYLPEMIASSEGLFVSAEIAGQNGHVDVGRCRTMAEIIRRISTLRPDGFGNLYLAALANCPPGSPYFPAAYHQGGSPQFALAVQAADLALEAIRTADSLAEAQKNLIAAIEDAAARLTLTADILSAKHQIEFGGIDFSLSPYPSAEFSLASALEEVGLTGVGAPGSLFAAGFIAEAIGRASFRHCGFSGLMLPVLEDSVLALRAAEGRLTVSDLLSYSAVCGVGLDTVPLPGNISETTLTGILLDVATLAVRLNKPLAARLMPLPGLEAGDPVHFDFPYFADSRVMSPPLGGPDGRLLNTGRIHLQAIHRA